MAALDEATNLFKRGFRGGADLLNRGATAVAGATAPVTPTTVAPTVAPAVAPTVAAAPISATPTAGGAVPPAPLPPQGLRGATGLGGPASATDAAPRVAPAAPAGPVAAGTPPAAPQGRLAGAAAGLVPGLLAGTALSGIGESFRTPTETYENRLGIKPGTRVYEDSGFPGVPVDQGFEDSTKGRIGQFVQDLGVRGAGVLSDFGANVLDLGVNAGNAGLSALGYQPEQTFNERLRAGDGAAPAPVTPTAAKPAAAPSLADGSFASLTGTPSFGPTDAPAPAPASNVAPTSTPGIGPDGLPVGIRRTGNSYTNVAPDGTAGATGQLPNTGVRFASDADIARYKAGQIGGGDAGGGLFDAPSGRATSFGSPLSSEPRMQVSADSSLGGRVSRRLAQRAEENAARREGLGIQQQEVGLRGRQIDQQARQFGAELGLRRDTLNETARHNDGTLNLGRDQLQRQDVRDRELAGFHTGELTNARERNQAEVGLRRDQLNREKEQDSIRNQAEANTRLETDLGNILPRTTDAKGNSVVDANNVQSHKADINATVAAMAREYSASNDPTIRAHGKQLAERGPQALGPAGLQQLVDLKAIKDRTLATKGLLPGSSDFVDSPDLRQYMPKQTSGTLYDTTTLQNNSTVRTANLRRKDPANFILPDIGNPETTRFNYLNGVRR